MKKKHLIPMAVVLFGLTALSFTLADGIKLKLQPQKGKTYTINVKNNSMNIMEVMGQPQNSTQTMETRQTFTIKEVTNDQSTIETELDALKLTISQMGQKLEYDSEHPEKTSPMLASQTSEMEKTLHKPATLTYDAQGNLVGEASDMEMSQLSVAIIKLPSEELAKGSKWTEEKDRSVSGADFKANMEYTVTAISKKSVEVSYTGDVKSDDINGTIKGTASIDPQTGIVMKRNETQNLSMTLSQQGLTIPVTMTANTTVTVTMK